VDENTITLTFDEVGSGLRAFDSNRLQGFAVEDANGRFVKARAEIVGKDQVRLSTKGIDAPQRVRYAWQNNPASANLTNEERLPATPFEITLEQQDPVASSAP